MDYTYGIHAVLKENDNIKTILFDIQARNEDEAYRIVYKALEQLGIKRYELELQYSLPTFHIA